MSSAPHPFFSSPDNQTPMFPPGQFSRLIDVPLSLMTLNLSPDNWAKFAFGSPDSQLTNLSQTLKQLIQESHMLAKVAQVILGRLTEQMETKSLAKLTQLSKKVPSSNKEPFTDDEVRKRILNQNMVKKYQKKTFSISYQDDRLNFSPKEKDDACEFLKKYFSIDLEKDSIEISLVVDQLFFEYQKNERKNPEKYNRFMQFILNKVIHFELTDFPSDAKSIVLLLQMTMGLSCVLISRENATTFGKASKKHMEIFGLDNCDEDLIMQLDKTVGSYKGLMIEKLQQLIRTEKRKEKAPIESIITVTIMAIIKLCELHCIQEPQFMITQLKAQLKALQAKEQGEEEEKDEDDNEEYDDFEEPEELAIRGKKPQSEELLTTFQRYSVALLSGQLRVKNKREISDLTDEIKESKSTARSRHDTTTNQGLTDDLQRRTNDAAKIAQTYIGRRTFQARHENGHNPLHRNSIFGRFNAGQKLGAASAFLSYLKNEIGFDDLQTHRPALMNGSLLDDIAYAVNELIDTPETTLPPNPTNKQIVEAWFAQEARKTTTPSI